jgi:methylmalonyl-CoA mutase
MTPDPSESPRLRDHFPAPSLEAWEARACKDLGIESFAEAAWSPEGLPPIPPLTRSADPVSIETRPSWRYADLLDERLPEQAALGLKEAMAGGADLAVLRCGPGGLPIPLLPDLMRSAQLPLVISTGHLSKESASILAKTNCAGYLVDPVAGFLRGESETDFSAVLSSVAESPLSETGRRCYAVDLRAWEEAGASPTYLAAAAFSAVTDWMVALTGQGLKAEDAAATLSIVVPASHELFPTIALFRAVRAGLVRVLRGFDVSTPIPIIGITAAAALEEKDPYTNLIRTTTAAVASVIGAADFLSIRPFDITDPSEIGRGRRLARNIAHLLRHEGHLDKVADPAAGSFYTEALTRTLGSAAWDLFTDWETRGGLTAVLSSGELGGQLARLRAERDQRMERGEITRIGVNQYVEGEVST